MYGFVTGEGLYGPAFCVDGSLNQNAWGYFSTTSPHVLGAGKAATVADVGAAFQSDQGATRAQEYWAYALAADYYGWNFKPSPVCVDLYQETVCHLDPPAYSASKSAVTAAVLPPATTLPVAGLCVTDVTATADGNWDPLFCARSINVVAWREYAKWSPRLLAAGRHATAAEVTAAMQADSVNHLTNVEQLDAYQLAAAYYGWKFTPNPACEYLYKTATCY